MSKIYKYFGLFFLIYSDEHKPIHIHVQSGRRESVIELYDEAGKVTKVVPRRLSKSASKGKQLTDKELGIAVKFVNIKAEEIIAAWKSIRKGTFDQKIIVITRKIV